MVGFEVGVGHIVVARAAGVDDLQAEAGGIRAGNLVAAVAVVAHGQSGIVRGFAREVDALAELDVDTRVTLGAGHVDARTVHARSHVLARHDGMRRVAVDTRRRHHQAALFQGLTVHALPVVGNHAAFGAFVAFVGLAAFVMAAAA